MKIGIIYENTIRFQQFKASILNYLRFVDKSTRKASMGNIQTDMIFIDFIDSNKRNKNKLDINSYDYLYLHSNVSGFLDYEITFKLSETSKEFDSIFNVYKSSYSFYDLEHIIMDGLRNFHESKVDIYRVKFSRYSPEISISKIFDWEHTMTSVDFYTKAEAENKVQEIIETKIKDYEKTIKNYEKTIKDYEKNIQITKESIDKLNKMKN